MFQNNMQIFNHLYKLEDKYFEYINLMRHSTEKMRNNFFYQTNRKNYILLRSHY